VSSGALPRAELGESRQLSARVASYLREAIMAGELRALEYIRTEHLATQLGVSATPVREALMVLQSEGVVRWEPRRGFRVLPLRRQDVLDLFALQAHVAGELAARAATELTANEIQTLGDTQDALCAAADRDDLATVGQLNHDLHRTINRAAASDRLASTLNMLTHHVPRSYYARISGWPDATVSDHDEILAALRGRDPESARAAMNRHITHIGELLVDHLGRSGALAP
jgi:DNA-binding GntR family transcriptional regulator